MPHQARQREGIPERYQTTGDPARRRAGTGRTPSGGRRWTSTAAWSLSTNCGALREAIDRSVNAAGCVVASVRNGAATLSHATHPMGRS